VHPGGDMVAGRVEERAEPHHFAAAFVSHWTSSGAIPR
jgi:hypothetical protein